MVAKSSKPDAPLFSCTRSAGTDLGRSGAYFGSRETELVPYSYTVKLFAYSTDAKLLPVQPFAACVGPSKLSVRNEKSPLERNGEFVLPFVQRIRQRVVRQKPVVT